MTDAIAEARPAATLILLRDHADGLQVLMVRRAATIKFYGGAWAFPGGRVEASDCAEGETIESLPAVQRAAVREVHEEIGLSVGTEQLTWMSHWITPIVRPKRFKTWFFVSAIERDARAGNGADDVRVDGAEIDAHQWLTFEQAFAAHRAQQMELPPPTFVTLSELSQFHRAQDALSALQASPPRHYFPKLVSIEGGVCSLYEGDAGYEREDPSAGAPHHRLVMLPSDWRYVRQ
jgi:8-oxo-dGTP pyrophosphatase MutT (NUDIX family)